MKPLKISHPEYLKKELKKEIITQPIEYLAKKDLENDFEKSMFKKFGHSATVKKKLYDIGAMYAAMSGSGSSVYGIFKDNSIGNKLYCRSWLFYRVIDAA